MHICISLFISLLINISHYFSVKHTAWNFRNTSIHISFFLFLHKTHGYSSEASGRGTSNYPQCMFLWRKKKNTFLFKKSLICSYGNMGIPCYILWVKFINLYFTYWLVPQKDISSLFLGFQESVKLRSHDPLCTGSQHSSYSCCCRHLKSDLCFHVYASASGQ